MALIALVEVSMRWRFPYWQDLIHDWANNVHYPLVFLLGFILMSDGRFKDAIFRNRHLGLIIGLLASIARIPNIDGVTGYVLDMTLRGVAEWSLLIALLGYGYQFLNRPSKLLRHTSEIAYPFYIWHQTVIVVIAFFIVRQQAGIGVKFLAISSASLLITWLICEAIKLTNITRFMFGLKAKKNTRRIEMKRLPAAMILVLMVFAATACTTVSTSGSYTLESGQTQRGNLIITSGTADLEEGSRVTGNVLMTSGVLNAEGEIGGDILFSSGDVNLGPKAAVGGDIRGTSGKVNQEDGARVDGRIQPNQSTFTIGGGIFSSIFAFLCGLPLILLGLLLVLFSILRNKPPSKTKTAETQVNPSIPAAGTTTKLQELKQLLDQGLISEDDYEAKKTEILSQM